MVRTLVCLLLSWALSAHAGQVFCRISTGGVGVPTYSETISVTDAGLPGLVFVGMTDPGQQWAQVLNLDSTWSAYQGGLYPPFARYDAGLPASQNVMVPLPVSDGTTGAIAGWSIYVGYGSLSLQSQQQIADRRAFLNQNKAKMVANGTWSTEYDSDDRMKWALVQQDLTKNNKYHLSLTVPYMDCNPPRGGGG